MDSTVFVWIAIVPAILVLQIYLLGRKMSQPEKMMRPMEKGLTPFQERTLAKYMDWLVSVNLKYCTSFRFGVAQVVVFQQDNEPRFLSFMFHRKLTFTIETWLEDLTIYETATSGNGDLFPRPGSYAESFRDISAQEAWHRHLEGETYLTRKFGFRWIPLKRPYEEILLDAIRLRMTYNRAQLLWPVRVLYRYFVTRRRIVNRTIAQQFP
jgi:hypothetical protein